MNSKHQFAVIRVSTETTVVQPFTTDVGLVASALESLGVDPGAEPQLDLDKFLHVLMQHAYPGDEGAPECVTRAILVFGRSSSVPLLQDLEQMGRLLYHERFFFDLLYIHRKVHSGAEQQEESQAQLIFEVLAGYFDSKNPLAETSLFLETTCGVSLLVSLVHMLLAHPLQRDPQEIFETKIALGEVVSSALQDEAR